MQKKKLYLDIVWGLVAALVLLVGFFTLSLGLTSNWLNSFDHTVSQAVHGARSDGLTPLALFFTSLGEAITEITLFAIVGSILYFRLKHKWEALVLFIGVVGAWLLNVLLKHAFERSRPDIQRLIEEEGFSFPSGHAMVSSLFYGLLGYLLWINVRDKWKAAWIIPLVALLVILCIGLSRVYLGVHYPSDIAAGFAAGGVCFLGCVAGLRTLRRRRERTAAPERAGAR